MSVYNLAVKLCGILQSQTDEDITAREWRILGQEQDGSQLFSWISTGSESEELLHIGVYTNKTKSLSVLHTFKERSNIIQASVNASHSLLVYVEKQLPNEDSESKEPLYCPYFLPLLPDGDDTPVKVEESSPKQIMVQYLYGKSYKYSPGVRNDRFLLMKHLDSIKIYRTTMVSTDHDDGTETWRLESSTLEPNTIVKVFSWAQWDCVNQVLYYIYYRQPVACFAEGEEAKSPSEVTPTLSGLQFHADLPHETVLNIPLNLPHLPSSGSGAACGEYEDDPLPLRVHDCSVDLQVVSDARGLLCICHHYLYKPLDNYTSMEDSAELKEGGVNFAYSVTLLHHGCVVHSVLPELPWTLAKSLRPSYTLYGDNQLLVNIPMLYTQLIDVTLSHQPCSHVVITNDDTTSSPSLAPLLGWPQNTMVDLNTLDVCTLTVPDKDLVATFKSDTVVENKLAILHYLILHEGNFDLVDELIQWACLNQNDGLGAFHKMLVEYLIGSAHASLRRSLPNSSLSVCDLLPFTEHLKFANVKVREYCVSVTQEKLWNSSVVVLTPRQRVCQFAEDLWTRLWVALNPSKENKRFQQSCVREKLALSLLCYQPEAVSRCGTPRSPLGGGGGFPGTRRASAAADALPFHELDVCTASRREHVAAANFRTVSLHVGGRDSGAAARWVAALHDASRDLCRALSTALQLNDRHSKGFSLIDDLDPSHAVIAFKTFEQYFLACETIAFPLPQGFSSFFSYLGRRALPAHLFMLYVHRGVLELQIDVLKHIICKEEDTKENISQKLRLVSMSGSRRARRSLGAWSVRDVLPLRARLHAADVLRGTEHAGISTLPQSSAGSRLPALDTFLELLTAKANLNELDFNLIIEATMLSLEEERAA